MLLETERLTIREFTMDDLDTLHHILAEDVKMDPSPREEHAAYIRWLALCNPQFTRLHQPPYGDRAIVLKKTGELIGSVGLVPSLLPADQLKYHAGQTPPPEDRRLTPEFGLYYVIATAHQRHGYASEAAGAIVRYVFTEWNVKRVIATTEFTNEASMAVMRRLGMKIYKNPHGFPFWFEVVGIVENTL